MQLVPNSFGSVKETWSQSSRKAASDSRRGGKGPSKTSKLLMTFAGKYPKMVRYEKGQLKQR
jgi:hypothetical protein